MFVTGAVSVGIVSLVAFLIERLPSLEAQIGAFLILGLVLGFSWTIAQIGKTLDGFITGLIGTAVVAVMLQVCDAELAKELPSNSRTQYELIRFLGPVTIYSALGIFPWLGR